MNREFAWINRSYEPTRNGYNALMKKHKESATPKGEALAQSTYAKARAHLKKEVCGGRQDHQGRRVEDDHKA